MNHYEFQGTTSEGQTAWLGIRPGQVVFGDDAKNLPVRLEVDVEVIEPMGADTLVWSRLAGQEFHFKVIGSCTLYVGEKIIIGFDPACASVFDMNTEQRL